MGFMETKNGSILTDLQFEFYNLNKRRQYRKENKGLLRKPIVFFGDSITDICDLEKYYPGVYAVNRGISGNTVNDLINRLDVSVTQADPAKIILLIGINDMMNLGRSATETAKNYERLLQKLKETFPAVPIVCQSVYPGYDAEANAINNGLIFPIRHLAADIVELNSYIQEFCKKYDCTYADIHSHLKQEDNTLIPAYSDDGCHPNDAGYQVISAELKKYI